MARGQRGTPARVRGGARVGTNSGYSPVVVGGGKVRVELGREHPGFADPAYRARRDEIAAAAFACGPEDPPPRIDYRDDEHALWRTVCSELRPLHRRYACTPVVEAAEALALPVDHVPQLDEVSELLAPLSGFVYRAVAGLAPLREFYGSFARRVFHSTQYLRHPSVPLYTPEPDLVHEVVGHANQLAHPFFASVYAAVGEAVARTRSAEALAFLSRVFWFTLEFGVVLEDGEPKAYGAGLLSSFGELQVFSRAELRGLDFAAMGSTEYDITRYQPVLFAARSFERLEEELARFFGEFDDDAYRELSRTTREAPLAGGGGRA